MNGQTVNARNAGGPTEKRPSLCLVHTPCSDLNDDRLEPPLGLLYLATVAQTYGHPVKLVDLASEPTAHLDLRIPDGYAVYGFSTYSVNYGLTRQLATAVRRRNPAALVVAGGPHATALPAQVIGHGFDVVVAGEGELAILTILRHLAQGNRPPQILIGERPERLDDLPFPDYSLVDLNTYTREVDGQRCVSLLSSRGCPYPCVFCNSNIMGAGRAIRFRSPEDVVAEIRQIKERYRIRHFRFQDDVFTCNIQRIRSLAPPLAQEEIVYRCFARVNAFSPEMARLLRDSGCVHVSFGVESGSPKLLAKQAMNKRQTPGQIRKALENACAAGIRSRIYLMVGFPGESDETIGQTLALVRGCPWDEFSVYPLIAYPGTPLYERPEAFGITHIDRDYAKYLQIGRDYKAGFTIRTETFDEEQVKQWRDYVIYELLADGRTWAGNAIGFK
jgi:radical SAM superfamily enzyme YgiQ (UPF0313 family)